MAIMNSNDPFQNTKRILFVGHLGIGSNALSLFKGFSKISDRIYSVDTRWFDAPAKYSIRRLVHHILPFIYDLVASKVLSFKILRKIRKYEPDLVFVFKGNYLNSTTLSKVTAVKAHYHPDDSSNSVNRTNTFDQAESSYDLHFTSKSQNLDEISARTNKPVHFIWYAYDPDWHFRAAELNFDSPIYDLGFIGNFRENRKELISDLAAILGKKFALTGLRWSKIVGISEKVSLSSGVFGPNYSHFVIDAPLQLGLLNSDNRDQHTARSFEIPATGALFLAEDTPEHREIFSTEKNALFFKTKDDLLSRIEWVRENPNIAKKIAENGYLHITNNHNSWQDRAAEILDLVKNFEKLELD
jgi:spore maturation protein CgeB